MKISYEKLDIFNKMSLLDNKSKPNTKFVDYCTYVMEIATSEISNNYFVRHLKAFQKNAGKSFDTSDRQVQPVYWEFYADVLSYRRIENLLDILEELYTWQQDPNWSGSHVIFEMLVNSNLNILRHKNLLFNVLETAFQYKNTLWASALMNIVLHFAENIEDILSEQVDADLTYMQKYIEMYQNIVTGKIGIDDSCLEEKLFEELMTKYNFANSRKLIY